LGISRETLSRIRPEVWFCDICQMNSGLNQLILCLISF
jgi:hypothetical protein